MSLKKSVLYVVLAMLFISLFFAGDQLSEQMREQMARNFAVMPYVLLIPLTGLPMGLIIGVHWLIGEVRKTGRWLIRWEKMIFFGLPFLYLMLYPALFYSNITFLILPVNAFSLTLLNAHSAIIGGLVRICCCDELL
ncbi:hypothetical protein [Alteribacter keqinensis]|uniref:Uncharacterized protein n=1 Tax=Alteribacter keqinensis TaxID=2483800 RepID=A0A3M7TRS7_9BACI|nr:hypothetical protein [Alteribacter keqinensis]RNA67899.1 hypothetical protein EBO34_14455 [Alteribacter keqinensis]